jgi:hypothetical protein
LRFSVETWAPDYGAASGDEVLQPGDTPVDVDVEVRSAEWSPRWAPPGTVPSPSVLFVDGVLRVDARIWVGGDAETDRPGLCGSYAAGAIRCAEAAELVAAEVRHGLFTSSSGATAVDTPHARYDVRAVAGEGNDQLMLGLQQRMRELEVGVAVEVGADADLVVVDGPLTDRQAVRGAVGFVKTHHASYLPEELGGIVGDLRPAQRTPVFLATTKWSRYSWYLRQPGDVGHDWAGIVRCEASADLDRGAVVALADRVAATLPRFASASHKDARAPQNLYPIGGLERELRRRLGDADLLYRSLRVAATGSTS